MGVVVVDVMLKSEILDPQGQAVAGALPRLGFEQFTSVRQGKHFVLTVDGEVTQDHLDAARDAAETLLSNPVMEDVVSVRAVGGNAAADAIDWSSDADIDLALRGTGARSPGAIHEVEPAKPRGTVGDVDALYDAGFVAGPVDGEAGR